MKGFFRFLMFSAAIFCAYSASAETDDLEKAGGKTLPANIMARGAADSGVILVDKYGKKLYRIKTYGDEFEINGMYDVIYGVNEGDKLVSGDGKTPEGVYYITSWLSGERLLKMYGDYAKIYGAGSFPLNYPNPVDKIRKKTGHGIWIHGRDPINGKDATQGCVALRNGDLTDLKEKTAVKDPVVITDKADFITENEYQAKRKELFAFFDGFIKSWAEGDYDTFKNYIHPDYRGQGKNAPAYLASKKRLMELYRKKTIETGNTKIFIQNGASLVIDTDQFYCAPNLSSYGNKRYYFTEEGGSMKLISEEMFPLPLSSAVKEKTEKFVREWADAWRSGNADKYITYYSENFKNGGMDKKEWYEYKKSVFEKAEEINLEISDIRTEAAGGSHKAVFRQKYSGGQVSDTGVKTITLEGCPGNFKITSETWKAN